MVEIEGEQKVIRNQVESKKNEEDNRSKKDKTNENDGKAQDLSSPEVTTKYRLAGTIANLALSKLISIINGDSLSANMEEKRLENSLDKGGKINQEEYKLLSSLDIAELCKYSDRIIVEETSKVYNKKAKGEKVEKGVAFPTCISVNELCAHFCPLESDSISLKTGDVVKIELGVHIDGYICVVGHTMIVKGGQGFIRKEVSKNEEPTYKENRKGDAIKAAWYAGDAALKSIKAGAKSTSVTNIIQKVIKEFRCNPVHRFSSHQMKRYVIDGNQRVANSESNEDKAEEFTFQHNEVYGVDIVVSTGEGKARESDMKTMVFKRAIETNYSLKTQLSRIFLSEVNKHYPTLPFTVRNMEDERAWKIGVAECLRHELLHPYVVLTEKPGEYVAQVKFTVLILPGGTRKITGFTYDIDNLKSNYEILDPELRKHLEMSNIGKKKKAKQSYSNATQP